MGFFSRLSKKDKQIFFVVLFAFLFVQAIPYLYGYFLAKDSHVFSSFLFLRIDLATYIAKIKQGIEGNWLFSFDYTHAEGGHYFIYTYYLLLGNIARLLTLSAFQIFHIARIVTSILLFVSVYRFVMLTLKDKISNFVYISLLMSVFGKGLSFFIEPHILMSSQLSAHLPLSLAILFYILAPFEDGSRKFYHYILYFVLAFVNAMISSFSTVPLLLILFGILIFKIIFKFPYKEAFWHLIVVGNGGGWVVLYQFVLMKTKPELMMWYGQNELPAIPFYMYIISFFPVILFSIIQVVHYLINPDKIKNELIPVIVWVLLFPVFVFIPFGLNVRFMIGIYPAMICLAMIFLFEKTPKKIYEFTIRVLFVVFLINLVYYNLNFIQSLNDDIHEKDDKSVYFISNDIYDSLLWIDANLEEDSLILSSYSVANHIPAYTSSRSVNGHWCETPNFEENQQFSDDFYAGLLDEDDLFEKHVDYVYFSAIERSVGDGLVEYDWVVVFENESVKIFEVVY